jgi:hypothetical protein
MDQSSWPGLGAFVTASPSLVSACFAAPTPRAAPPEDDPDDPDDPDEDWLSDWSTPAKSGWFATR